jgi:hypothetical protein
LNFGDGSDMFSAEGLQADINQLSSSSRLIRLRYFPRV